MKSSSYRSLKIFTGHIYCLLDQLQAALETNGLNWPDMDGGSLMCLFAC